MNKKILLSKTKEYVKKKMKGESTGHDWFHVERVFKMAIKIAREENNGDIFIIGLASFLHDIGDWKLNISEKSEREIVREAGRELGIPQSTIEQVVAIITNMSYSKNLDGNSKLNIEGQIVQDADRLDALGAIGIARAFAYGGKKDRELYNPTAKPTKFKSTNDYRNAKGTTINHFYEKLFLLKSLLNTKSAKKIANKREAFMKMFLEEFYKEWEGKI